MAGSLNKVMLIGNLGADPEIRTFNNGGKVANLRIATSEQWKDRQTGERKEKTEWHTITVWSEGLVKVVEQYVRKGAKLMVQGQLQTRKWQDKEGKDQYTTEIVANEMQMLDSRGGSGGGGMGGGGGEDYGSYPEARGAPARSNRSPEAAGVNEMDPAMEDDIPF